jgi:hypothetical protein
MADMVEEALGKDPNTTERNSMLQQHGLASILCQYSHWVSDMSFGSIDVKDLDTVNAMLTHLSSDDELRTKILEAVKAYINDSTISIIGIPTYDCPSCKEPQTKPNDKPLIKSAIEGASLRFRPIIMTSLAFIAGIIPLAISSGAGANSRISIGTGIIGGTLTGTILAIFYVPLMFVLIKKIFARKEQKGIKNV